MVDEEEERRGLLKFSVLLSLLLAADEGKGESGVWEGKVAVGVLRM